MYGNYLDEEAKIVAENRDRNIKFEPARLTAEEKDELLLKNHPAPPPPIIRTSVS